MTASSHVCVNELDVYKIKCVATIKNESRKKLEQSSFDNTTSGIVGFIRHIKKTYGKDMQAVCESTAEKLVSYAGRAHHHIEIVQIYIEEEV